MSKREDLSAILTELESNSGRRLSRDELRSFPSLYREVIAELADKRAHGLPPQALQDLEALLIRAHAALYVPQPASVAVASLQLLRAFPAAVRQHARYILVAALLLGGGVAWGYAEVRRDPTSAQVLLSPGWERNAEHFQEGSGHDGDPLRSAFYFTNNATVALQGFALGGTFGVGTMLMLLFNGIILGATAAVVQSIGSPAALLSFILPHSGWEITAILIAAAGGLSMGDALLRPGWRSRPAALMHAAREALPLALGAAAMMIVAGLVESWISPMAMPLSSKAAIAAGLDLALVLYLASSPTDRRRRTDMLESRA